MTTDLSVPCLRCGRPSLPHGEHHHREGSGPKGSGMGGVGPKAHEHPVRAALCRECHDDLHHSVPRWKLSIRDGWARGYWVEKPEEPMFERPVVFDNDSEDPAEWEDEVLAQALFAVEDKKDELQAQYCAVYWQRYRWADDWSEQAAADITNYTGQHAHPRTVRRMANAWLLFGDDWGQVKKLGKTLAYYIAESKGDRPALLEEARTHLGDGVPARHVVGLLRQANDSAVNSAEAEKAPCTEHDWRCSHCGIAKEATHA